MPKSHVWTHTPKQRKSHSRLRQHAYTVYTHIHTGNHTLANNHVDKHTHTHTHTHTHRQSKKHTHTHTHRQLHTCKHSYTHTYTQTNTHTGRFISSNYMNGEAQAIDRSQEVRTEVQADATVTPPSSRSIFRVTLRAEQAHRSMELVQPSDRGVSESQQGDGTLVSREGGGDSHIYCTRLSCNSHPQPMGRERHDSCKHECWSRPF